MVKEVVSVNMQKGDVVGLVIVGTILLGIGVFFWFAAEAPTDIYAPVEITGSAIVMDAAAEGRTVRVAAEVVQSGFVTVHQAIGEAPGPIIGQSPLLSVGSHSEVVIETTEILSPPNEYFVLLFVDDGDSVFEAGIDLPVMSNGQVVKQKVNL